MKNFLKTLTLTFATITLVSFTGCLTSKQVTTNPNGTSTTNTVVNQANLLLDTSVLQGATAIATSVAIQKDPSVIPALKDTQVALNGILNGSNSNTTTQVLGLLGTNSNPVLAAEITPLIGTVSGLEQTLLAKYGTNVAGQISIAIAKAVDGGLVVGLNGK